MGESISWSFDAKGSVGGFSSAVGTTDAEAVLTSKTVVAPATEPTLLLQLENAAKISFLAISASDYSGKVTITVGAKAVDLTGPLVLYGKAVALLGADLGKLKVKNSAAADIDLSILAGLNVV